MKSALVASVRETRGSDRVRRTLTVNGGAEVFFEISGSVLPPAINLYAVATLFFAMRERRPLHIDGPVSAAPLGDGRNFVFVGCTLMMLILVGETYGEYKH